MARAKPAGESLSLGYRRTVLMSPWRFRESRPAPNLVWQQMECRRFTVTQAGREKSGVRLREKGFNSLLRRVSFWAANHILSALSGAVGGIEMKQDDKSLIDILRHLAIMPRH
jgi:hypothetical protein